MRHETKTKGNEMKSNAKQQSEAKRLKEKIRRFNELRARHEKQSGAE